MTEHNAMAFRVYVDGQIALIQSPARSRLEIIRGSCTPPPMFPPCYIA